MIYLIIFVTGVVVGALSADVLIRVSDRIKDLLERDGAAR
jgi:hypothetical protein